MSVIFPHIISHFQDYSHWYQEVSESDGMLIPYLTSTHFKILHFMMKNEKKHQFTLEQE